MANQRPLVLSIGSEITVFDSRNRVLEFAGFEVVGALEGHGALETVRDHSFDLVVIGHSMPAGSRLQILRQIKAAKPNVPILVIYEAGEAGQDIVEADAACDSLDHPERLIKTAMSLIRFAPRKERNCSARAARAR